MGKSIGTFIQSTSVGLALALLPLGTAAVLPNQAIISLSETGTSAQIGSGNQQADAKMMMPNPFTYEYIAGPELSDKSGTGHIYKLSLNLAGSPESALSRIAEAMGFKGQVTKAEYSTDEYPVYVIGNQDGTNVSAGINWSGAGNWWYTNPAAWTSPMPICGGELDAEGNQICNSPGPTPELLPSKSEMIAAALQIFNATGLRVTAADIHTDLNDWGANAYASMKIGGQQSPLEWQINWGSNGKIGNISGNLASAHDLGEYSTVSAKQAVARMGDWRYSGAVAQSVWAKYQPTGVGKFVNYDDAVSSEPVPSPSTITVQVNKSVETQMMIWDKSGTVWLVPGYLLIADEGWLTPIFSLEDGVVQLPDPVEISPMVK